MPEPHTARSSSINLLGHLRFLCGIGRHLDDDEIFGFLNDDPAIPIEAISKDFSDIRASIRNLQRKVQLNIQKVHEILEEKMGKSSLPDSPDILKSPDKASAAEAITGGKKKKKVLTVVLISVGSLALIVGGYFTYASLGEGRESAPGQITVSHLRKIYEMLSGRERKIYKMESR